MGHTAIRLALPQRSTTQEPQHAAETTADTHPSRSTDQPNNETPEEIKTPLNNLKYRKDPKTEERIQSAADERMAAAKQLTGNPQAIPALLESAELDPDPKVRMVALTALKNTTVPVEQMSAVFHVFQKILSQSNVSRQTVITIISIQENLFPEYQKHLITLTLESNDPVARQQNIIQLSQLSQLGLSDESVLQLIKLSKQDSQAIVRGAAIQALGLSAYNKYHLSQEIGEAFIYSITNDDHAMVRLMATEEAINYFLGTQAPPKLIKALRHNSRHDDNPLVRNASKFALNNLSDNFFIVFPDIGLLSGAHTSSGHGTDPLLGVNAGVNFFFGRFKSYGGFGVDYAWRGTFKKAGSRHLRNNNHGIRQRLFFGSAGNLGFLAETGLLLTRNQISKKFELGLEGSLNLSILSFAAVGPFVGTTHLKNAGKDIYGGLQISGMFPIIGKGF